MNTRYVHVQMRKRTAPQLLNSALNTAKHEQPVKGLVKTACTLKLSYSHVVIIYRMHHFIKQLSHTRERYQS